MECNLTFLPRMPCSVPGRWWRMGQTSSMLGASLPALEPTSSLPKTKPQEYFPPSGLSLVQYTPFPLFTLFQLAGPQSCQPHLHLFLEHCRSYSVHWQEFKPSHQNMHLGCPWQGSSALHLQSRFYVSCHCFTSYNNATSGCSSISFPPESLIQIILANGLRNRGTVSFPFQGKPCDRSSSEVAKLDQVHVMVALIGLVPASLKYPLALIVRGQDFVSGESMCRAMKEDRILCQVPLSVDTFHSSVAREAVHAGADIVNDVSGGKIDPDMLATVCNWVYFQWLPCSD